MDAKELINIIQPEHGRTSCNDEELNNGFYSNTSFTRCARCTLLQILKERKLPNSHKMVSVQFCIDTIEAKKEIKKKGEY